MKIKNLFVKDIARPINGVVKAEQLDEASIWQELDEFVVTREMDHHFRKFFSVCQKAVTNPNDPSIQGAVGVWISGFFGSGKSHLLKVLSLILKNGEHTNEKERCNAVDFFETKLVDKSVFAEVKRVAAEHADVVLFNIASKADSTRGRDRLLLAFLQVLNEAQGFCGDYPHVAHVERELTALGKLEAFQEAFKALTGQEWVKRRSRYAFYRDQIIETFASITGQSVTSATSWFDHAEKHLQLTIENFCKWVKDYLDGRGPKHRIYFFVDEVGQFIGMDSNLMLDLQTITEQLGVVCKGRAWIVVTSQADMDTVLENMRTEHRANDFSKISARFVTRLSLSGANVDEVIQRRLLNKSDEASKELAKVHATHQNVLLNQLTFSQTGMTFKTVRETDDFIKSYPCVPYQFVVMQKVFDSVRKAGATGVFLSRNERSMLDAFQVAVRSIEEDEVGALVPFHLFYPALESFLDTKVKMTIDQAADRESLQHPFDDHLLKTLFMIRYVDEMKGSLDNLTTLFVDRIDADKVALRKNISEALERLYKESLIGRSGEFWYFLTDEERDVERQIKAIELEAGDDSRVLAEVLFKDILSENRKFTYSGNKKVFNINRWCDDLAYGNQLEDGLTVHLVTPLADDYEEWRGNAGVLKSTENNGSVVIVLPVETTDFKNDEIVKAARLYRRVEKFLKRTDAGTQTESGKAIFKSQSSENQRRSQFLVRTLKERIGHATIYVSGTVYATKTADPQSLLTEAASVLVENTFTKMHYIERICQRPEDELRELLRPGAAPSFDLDVPESNPLAIKEVQGYLDLMATKGAQVTLKDLCVRFELRPYGWPILETSLVLARLLVQGRIRLLQNQSPVADNQVSGFLLSPSNRSNIVIERREALDQKVFKNARLLAKSLFNSLCAENEKDFDADIQQKFGIWVEKLKGYQSIQKNGYPGEAMTEFCLSVIKPLLDERDPRARIKRFAEAHVELEKVSENIHTLTHFFEHQRTAFDKLTNALSTFKGNYDEIGKDPAAATAYGRMIEIREAQEPYGLLKETTGLIAVVEPVNQSCVDKTRAEALRSVDAAFQSVVAELKSVQADETLSGSVLMSLQNLRDIVGKTSSVAHLKLYGGQTCDERRLEAFNQIHEWAEKKNSDKKTTVQKTKPVCTVKVSSVAKAGFMESEDEVEAFVDRLRQELLAKVRAGNRVEVR